jgi:hypothetical protein
MTIPIEIDLENYTTLSKTRPVV